MKTKRNQHDDERDAFVPETFRRHYVSAVDDGEHEELEAQANNGNLSRVFTFLLLLHVFLIGSVVLYNVIAEKPRANNAENTATNKTPAAAPTPQQQQNQTATATPAPQEATPQAAPPADQEVTEHIVTSGQNLQSISDITGATKEEIVQMNRLNENGELYVGRKLLVPKRSASAATSQAVVNPTPPASNQAEQKTAAAKQEAPKSTPPAPAAKPAPEPAKANNPPAALDKPAQKRPEAVAKNDQPAKPRPEATPAKPAASRGGSHEVQGGETFYSISRKYGVNVNELMKLNNVTDPGKLRKGTVLRLPAK